MTSQRKKPGRRSDAVPASGHSNFFEAIASRGAKVMAVSFALASLLVLRMGIAQADDVLPALSKRANFNSELPTSDSRYIADWVVDSADNDGMPFMIIDKTVAKAFLFDAHGRLRGASVVLLGSAIGDDSAKDIGTRKLANIRPDERTTPSGRFVASLAKNLHGREILWIDYDAAISLHRVVTSNRKEQRAQRLATATPLDNRISYGCINVPATFYENMVSPAFTGTNGVVYVLPETRSVRGAFGSYDVGQRKHPNASAHASSDSSPSQR